MPINPLHFRNYRKDDLKVSLAGVTMNLILALVFLIPAYAVFIRAFSPFREIYYLPDGDLARLQNALVDYRPISEMWGSVPAGLYRGARHVVL